MHKNFNMHPYQLIGWTCLFEGFTFIAQNDLIISCGYLYNDEFDKDYFKSAFTTFGILKNNEYLRTISFSVHWYLQSTIFFANLTMNCLIFVDLYYTIKNPFKPREQRLGGYILSTLITSPLAAYSFSKINNNCSTNSEVNSFNTVYLSSLLILIIVALGPILLNYIISFRVLRLFNSKGSST